METLDVSKFKIYSIGIAAENLPLGQFFLEVTPNEIIPFIDGELARTLTTVSSKGVDASGAPYTVVTQSAITLKCNWLQMGSNRVTPPNVRRGERVLIWRFADQDKFYWSALGLDDYLRRLETATFAFSDTVDETVKKLDHTNSYYFEVSTNKGAITLGTSKSNGEPFAYTVQINAKTGAFVLTDDASTPNFVQMVSSNQEITLSNSAGTYGSLIGTVITFESADQINFQTNAYTLKCQTSNVQASQSIVANAGTTISYTATGNMSYSTGGAYSLTTASTATIVAPSSVTLTTPLVNASGNITAVGIITGASLNIGAGAIVDNGTVMTFNNGSNIVVTAGTITVQGVVLPQAITTLQSSVSSLSSASSSNTSSISTINSEITTINSEVATLQGLVAEARHMLARITSMVSITSVEDIALKALLPIGSLTSASILRVKLYGQYTDAGTSVGTSTFNVRFGTLGTVADALIQTMQVQDTNSTATASPFTLDVDVVFNSSGATVVMGASMTLLSPGINGSITLNPVTITPNGAAPVNTTVNVAVANYISITAKSADLDSNFTIYNAYCELIHY